MSCSLNVIIIVVLSVTWSSLAAPDVRLQSGIARGYDREVSDTGRFYSAYYGIPFAEPPVGELRFLTPRPFLGRGPDAVITSSTFRAACYQPGLPQERLSEDCLHLNVFTPPDVDFGPLRKVMVWIHGGGFFIGDASLYLPSKLVTEYDVIVVTVQYRIGALGFLSSGDNALPGNRGLYDQILALQWVKDNIRQFAGDPDDITIFGESAGSASVAALSLTPATKGLFNKAIMQSGTILSPWALGENPQDQFYQHARDTGCLPRVYNPWNTLGYHESIVACLKRKSPNEIINAAEELVYSDPLTKSIDELPLFAPVVDGILLPRAPASLLSDKAYLQNIGALDRSYILGVNDNEGLILASQVPKREYGNFTRPSNVASLIKSTVRSYLGWTSIDTLNIVDFLYTFPRSANGEIPLQNILALNGDMSYNVPTVLFSRALAKASPSIPIFLYVFDAEPKLKDLDGPLRGTSHGMDLYYEFDLPPNDLDQLVFFYADLDPVKFPTLERAFTSFVTSFAKTGTPSTIGISSWPRYDSTTESYVALSTQPEVRERMFEQRTALWTDFLPRMTTASGWFGERSKRAAFN
ncbi:carboxylic ester hydrolase [Elysia marginata]|uniref:Carboxylic ester hydrolase n=1 Tax=Elysia marginata TaxID=1093978 RepID=A0AAV4GX11_9GAST|nr:carboxylic ester hydrolase [Elysia marginata]